MIITFTIWGLVQERILTQPYGDDYFEYSYGLVFLNRLGGFVISAILMYYYRTQWVTSPMWEYSFPSVANMLSSWCQYEALKYVSFPTQMLAKSFKILPTMLTGKFLQNKTYETHEYVEAALIGYGLYLFLNSTENIDFTTNIFGSSKGVSGAVCGVVLLLLFLFFDSFTGQFQNRMFKLHPEMSPIQMMVTMNAFSMIFSFVTLVHQVSRPLSMECYSLFFYLCCIHPTWVIHSPPPSVVSSMIVIFLSGPLYRAGRAVCFYGLHHRAFVAGVASTYLLRLLHCRAMLYFLYRYARISPHMLVPYLLARCLFICVYQVCLFILR